MLFFIIRIENFEEMRRAMQICRLTKRNIKTGLELVEEVFDEFLEPIYTKMGVETFRYFIREENIISMMEKGEMIFYGAYVENELVGVIALRSPQHLSLLFVKQEYQRQGVAKKLFRMVRSLYVGKKLEKPYLTVNASPYAVEVYKRLGFAPIGKEEEKDGIRFTPMLFRLDI